MKSVRAKKVALESAPLDLLTHSLVGLHLARLPSATGIPPGARLLLCLAASNAPDLDRSLLIPLQESLLPIGPAGPLHSMLGAALLAAALAGIAWPLVAPRHRRTVAFLVTAAVALHLLGDALSVVRLPLLWPLSSRRFGLAWFSEADPWLGVLLAAPLVRDFLADRRAEGRLHLSWRRSRVLPLVALYLSICAASKVRALQATWAHHRGGAQVEEVQAYPAGPGPFRWTTLARTDEQLWHRNVFSVLGSLTPAGTFPTGDADPRMQIALETIAGADFRRSARAPFLAQATGVGEDGSFEVALGDLRFSDPRSDRLPWVLWMRIGPDFTPTEWAIVSTPHTAP
jgi:membrane-bound metal-dependent hydrolase YbcI (DUF457 family)